MAYQFSNDQDASATVYLYRDAFQSRKYKIAGINGRQTSADNFKTAIDGLMNVIGANTQNGLTRTLTQEVQTVS